MAGERIHEVAARLATWLPSETEDFRDLVARILAALPGGEVIEWVEPLSIGWAEVALLQELLSVLHDASDVEYVAKTVFGLDEVEE
jgi:hypothetical protein